MTPAVASSDFSACLTCGTSGSLGASFRNFENAAIAVFVSPAACAAWPSWIWVVASLGLSFTSRL